MSNIFNLDEIMPKGNSKRIMSFNVLNVFVAKPADWHCAERRAAGAAELILASDCDFVCLQEYDSFYRWNEENIHSKIASKYTEVKLQGFLDYNIWNPIFYDAQKYTVIESGVVDFFAAGIKSREYFSDHDGTKRSHFREFVWAVFEDITDKKQYLVGSLHFSAGEELDLYHREESEMVIHRVREILKKYNATVLIAGDYNSAPSIVNRGRFYMKEAGFIDTHDLTENVDNSPSDSKGKGEYETHAIDHVMTLSDIRVEGHYKTMPERLSHVSDHSPLVVQFT